MQFVFDKVLPALLTYIFLLLCITMTWLTYSLLNMTPGELGTPKEGYQCECPCYTKWQTIDKVLVPP